jgi:hypothetical protein
MKLVQYFVVLEHRRFAVDSVEEGEKLVDSLATRGHREARLEWVWLGGHRTRTASSDSASVT